MADKPQYRWRTTKVWSTADGTKLVPEGDPEASLLVAVPRQQRLASQLERYENVDEFFSVNPPQPEAAVSPIAPVNSTAAVGGVVTNPPDGSAPETPLVTLTKTDGTKVPSDKAPAPKATKLRTTRASRAKAAKADK